MCDIEICNRYGEQSEVEYGPEGMKLKYNQIGPSELHALSRKLVYTINGVISLSSFFSPPGYFSPRTGYCRVPKFCMGFQVTQKNKIWGEQKFGGPPLPPWWAIF